MKPLKDLKVGSRLMLGFSIMILFLAVVGFAGYWSLTNIGANLQDIYKVRLPKTENLLQCDRDLQQALVAERSMIFANVSSDEFKTLVSTYEENLNLSEECMKHFSSLPMNTEEQAIFGKYQKARQEWQNVSKQVVEGRRADTREGRRLALDLSVGIEKEKFEEMRSYIDQLENLNLKLAGNAQEAADATFRRTMAVLLITIGLGLLAGIALMITISRGVTKPLQVVIEGLTAASEQVSAAAGQLSISSQSLAEGSSEQAAAIEETSSSLEEMSSMTRQNAGNADEAKNLVKSANETVVKANDSMDGLTRAMEEISKASEETSKIIKTIDEIAFQTNLLALNAAVEAARAGDAGAGFAVVADEVRNLAMRAADAAKNTADLIEGTVKKVKDGSSIVTSTSEAFAQVADSSRKVSELVDEIAAASNEQAQGIEQVNRAVLEMDKVTQANAANAEESSSGSEEMSAQAEQMKGFVNQLVGLVGINGGEGRGLSRAEVSEPRRVVNQRKADSALRNKVQREKVPVYKTRKAKPEQVIPMNDSDFTDF